MLVLYYFTLFVFHIQLFYLNSYNKYNKTKYYIAILVSRYNYKHFMLIALASYRKNPAATVLTYNVVYNVIK